MNRRNVSIAGWVTAAVLLTAGVVSMGRAAMSHRRQAAAIERSQAQLAILQRLETEMAAAFVPVSAWEQIVNEPIPWRGLLRELDLEANVIVGEQRTLPMDLSGWNLRRTEITAGDLAPADLWRLINRAQSQPHPWRLRYVTLTATADTPAILDARLRFETVVPR